MKTLSKSLSVDSRFLHLYRPLVRRLLLAFLVTAAFALAALLYFDERLVKRSSSGFISNATASVDENLLRRLSTNNQLIMIAIGQIDGIPFEGEASAGEFFAKLSPFLRSYPMINSINVADTAGNEFVVIRDADGYLTRAIDAGNPDVANWQRIRDGQTIESWQRASPTPPTERPWFKGAMQHDVRGRFWTDPYEFLTTAEPGISVSTRWVPGQAALERVMAFNISLSDVSRMTMDQRPSDNGIVFVFDEADRVIGLPRHERFDDERSKAASILSPINEIGVPNAEMATAAWRQQGATETVFPYTGPEGKAWWAGFSRVELDDSHALWSAVLVPRSDLLGALVVARNLTVLGIIVTGVLVSAIMFFVSMRSIRRQMKQAIDRIEEKLGQYHVEERIGEGGNGTVYRARHALLRRPTALKLMNAEFARSDAARERFKHEVRLTSGLSHPNTVAIYDFGHTADNTLYYAMELLEGGTLNRLVQVSGPLSAGRAIHFLLQACGSLAEAHSKGLIHRDIKPSNLIVCERGGMYDVLKLVDFGLVKEISQVDGNLTQADVLIGTPFFMAPEIIKQPGAASPQSDLYALGAVAYFILSGRQVFEGESAVDICAAHIHDTPERPSSRSGRDIPQDLEDLVLRCLAKDPASRPSSAEELRDALMQCQDAGVWSSADGKTWWQEFGSGLVSVADDDDVPMSRTGLIVDLDSRIMSLESPSESL